MARNPRTSAHKEDMDMHLATLHAQVQAHDSQIEKLGQAIESLGKEMREANQATSQHFRDLGNKIFMELDAVKGTLANSRAVNWPLVISMLVLGISILTASMGGVLWLATVQTERFVQPVSVRTGFAEASLASLGKEVQTLRQELHTHEVATAKTQQRFDTYFSLLLPGVPAK